MKLRVRILCLGMAMAMIFSGCHAGSEPTETSSIPVVQLGGELICVEISRFSGYFVEDGSDVRVTDVAAILVANQTGKYVDLATVTYTVGDKTATFQVTGLPAGARAWVLEKNKLVIGDGDELVFEDCQVSYRADAIGSTDALAVSRQENTLTLENRSGKRLKSVCVYYKNALDDGTFLGGITYMMNFGDLDAGATAQLSAGHFGDESTIVRYSYQTE